MIGPGSIMIPSPKRTGRSDEAGTNRLPSPEFGIQLDATAREVAPHMEPESWNVYIYIYLYKHMYMYMYIYIYTYLIIFEYETSLRF